MTWHATTSAADIKNGGRFQVTEMSHAPELPRPAYTVGDSVLIEKATGFKVSGKIVAKTSSTFDVELDDGVTLRFEPTPPGAPPTGNYTGVPFHDFMAKAI